MNPSQGRDRQIELLLQISDFVGRSTGLRREQRASEDRLVIRQSVDGKTLTIPAEALDDVLVRVDADGQNFIQVNFASGSKILLTHALIGFKPAKLAGLSPARLPKVVTTPDIVSVFEAIQEALHGAEANGTNEDLLLLRKVFEAVVSGGEEAGFNLSHERSWLRRIPTTSVRATA